MALLAWTKAEKLQQGMNSIVSLIGGTNLLFFLLLSDIDCNGFSSLQRLNVGQQDDGQRGRLQPVGQSSTGTLADAHLLPSGCAKLSLFTVSAQRSILTLFILSANLFVVVSRCLKSAPYPCSYRRTTFNSGHDSG